MNPAGASGGPVDGPGEVHDAAAHRGIGCIFTGKGHRRAGVPRAAVAGVLVAIEDAGGGVVEAYPEQVEDRRPQQGAYFHTGPETLFEELGFERDRRIAKWRWVMRRRVAASTAVMCRPASPAGEQAARRRTAAQ